MNKHDEKTKRKKKNTTAVLRVNSSHLIPEFLRQKQFLLTKNLFWLEFPCFFFLVFETVAEQEHSPTNVCADKNITISQNANNSFAEIIKETN